MLTEPNEGGPTGLDAGLLRGDPVAYRAGVSPEKLAVIDIGSGTRLSYGALDRQIDRVASGLRRLVPGASGERVAVLGRNSIEQVVLALACQRAGAVFVPLNWRLAVPELRALIGDCDPALLVHDAEFAGTAAAARGRGMVGSFEAVAAAGTPPNLQGPGTGGDDAAIPFALLYTSGTTGRPKGVVVSRVNAAFAALNFALVGEVGPEAVVLSDLPLFHTIGLIAVTRTTLTMGGTLVISDRFVASRTLQWLQHPEIGITHYFGVPQIARALRAEAGFDGKRLSRLRAIFLGGAPLPAALVESFAAEGVKLVNGYGMSEAGTVVHMPIAGGSGGADAAAIGHPAPFMDIRIVDPAMADVAAGEIGELLIRGPAVTPGYWKRPTETEAAFHDGWFRTGDLVARNAAGLIRLVDRLKDMYISGGENVYPAEVEAALLALSGVGDAAVVGVTDERWGEVGVAFIVPSVGATVQEGEIRDHCEARLARYKCPARIVFAESIPRTASGKVQKHLLRAGL